MGKERLDQLLVQRNLASSREKAQRMILAGSVEVKGVRSVKPGHRVADDIDIHIRATAPFVSRGGEKLQGAFEAFGLDVNDRVCVDIGSSTGGFTDCMLQHGASAVYAVDVGKGQLEWSLRNDPRVTVMEGVNARYLKPEDFDPPPDFATADVSFISLTKILPAVTQILADRAELVTLIKPQFEAGREKVGKGGVVRDHAVHEETIEKVRKFGEEELGLCWKGCTTSPLKGPAGNIEFLAHWEKA